MENVVDTKCHWIDPFRPEYQTCFCLCISINPGKVPKLRVVSTVRNTGSSTTNCFPTIFLTLPLKSSSDERKFWSLKGRLFFMSFYLFEIWCMKQACIYRKYPAERALTSDCSTNNFIKVVNRKIVCTKQDWKHILWSSKKWMTLPAGCYSNVC